MIHTTRAQREALARVYHRRDLGMSYCAFRRTIVQGDYDCIMVQWVGMWLGIETDGYTHS